MALPRWYRTSGNIPFVQIDTRPQTGIASVAIDQAFGSKLATEHLIKLGHHQIAEISGPLNWHDAMQRHQSWLDTMQSYQLSVEMSVEGNWTAQSGYEAVHELVKTKAKFTGLVVANDQMALGAIAALKELGLNVPQDVSIVGFDDVPEAAYFSPALTTIRQDFSALGGKVLPIWYRLWKIQKLKFISACCIQNSLSETAPLLYRRTRHESA
jgi:DNA-binding LacI/PurR family transcriptional regulator